MYLPIYQLNYSRYALILLIIVTLSSDIADDIISPALRYVR